MSNCVNLLSGRDRADGLSDDKPLEEAGGTAAEDGLVATLRDFSGLDLFERHRSRSASDLQWLLIVHEKLQAKLTKSHDSACDGAVEIRSVAERYT